MRLMNTSLSIDPTPTRYARWSRIVILTAGAVAHVPVCQADTESNLDAARLQLIKKYADTVLEDAADRYHSEHP